MLTEPYCPEEWEEDEPCLERGEAGTLDNYITPEDVACPRCGKLLFRTSCGSDFVIEIFCKRCRKAVQVRYHSRRKIGF